MLCLRPESKFFSGTSISNFNNVWFGWQSERAASVESPCDIKPTSSERKMIPAAVCNMPCNAWRISCASLIFARPCMHGIWLPSQVPCHLEVLRTPLGSWTDCFLAWGWHVCACSVWLLCQLIRFICHRFCLRLASGIGSGNSTAKHARAVGDLCASENFNKTLDSI